MSPVAFRNAQVKIVLREMDVKDQKMAEHYYDRFCKGLTNRGKVGLTPDEIEEGVHNLHIPGLKKLSVYEDEEVDQVPIPEEIDFSLAVDDEDYDDELGDF